MYAIELALAKQQAGLEAVVTLAFQVAIDGMKISVDNLQKNMDAHMETVKGLVEKVDHIQADIGSLKPEVTNNSSELEKMCVKIVAR